MLPIGELEYQKAKTYIRKYDLKTLRWLHLAVMANNGIPIIATEDKDFDRTNVNRIWLDKHNLSVKLNKDLNNAN